MRKLIYAINVTIDGCYDHTNMTVNDEILGYWTEVVRGAGLLVYGRVTYQLMIPYWPEVAKDHSASKVDKDFADTFDSIDKVVFSRSLERVEDKKSRIVRTDLQDEILKLKQEDGKPIMVGGVDLPSQLIALGLVDEYLFVVHPVIAGGGKRLMEGIDLPNKLKLQLIDSNRISAGSIALRYLKQ